MNGNIVDAGFSPSHQAILGKLPLLIAVGPIPIIGVIVPFILKANRDPVVGKTPQFFLQAVVQFPVPFASQKRLDGLTTTEKFCSVAPLGIFCVSQRNAFWIAGIPGIFGCLNFGLCRFKGKGW